MSNYINNNYVRVVRKLPRPTDIQISQFASYVSNAHSWYKRLSLYPIIPFYFFIDPNVTKKMIRDKKTGKIRFEEEIGETGFHYNHCSTKIYHKNFGYWNYYFPTVFLGRRKVPILDTQSPDHQNGMYLKVYDSQDENVLDMYCQNEVCLKIFDLQGKIIKTPPELVELSKVHLSAFMHRKIGRYLGPRFHPVNEEYLKRKRAQQLYAMKNTMNNFLDIVYDDLVTNYSKANN
jgi:hypothetical protein